VRLKRVRSGGLTATGVWVRIATNARSQRRGVKKIAKAPVRKIASQYAPIAAVPIGMDRTIRSAEKSLIQTHVRNTA